MVSILQSLHLPHNQMDDDPATEVQQQSENISRGNGWVLLPMMSTTPAGSSDTTKSDLRSSSLGDKLQDALERTRKLLISTSSKTNNQDCIRKNEAVLFLGMDSPELPIEEIVYGLQISSGNHHLSCSNNKSNISQQRGKAHMCPANDGGYGLLALPKHAPSSKIFSGVSWSSSLTAVSQLKSLTDSNIDVSIGRLMYDVDEPADVDELVVRLIHSQSSKNKEERLHDALTTTSAGITTNSLFDAQNRYPHHTLNALIKLGIIQCGGEREIAKNTEHVKCR